MDKKIINMGKNYPIIGVKINKETREILFVIKTIPQIKKNRNPNKLILTPSYITTNEEIIDEILVKLDIDDKLFLELYNFWNSIPEISNPVANPDFRLIYSPSLSIVPLNFIIKRNKELKHKNWKNKEFTYEDNFKLWEQQNKYSLTTNQGRSILRNLLYKSVIINRYSNRYKTNLNCIAPAVSIKKIESYSDVFYSLSKASVFEKNWNYIKENWEKFEPFLRENLFARQMLLQFLWKFKKIDKISFLKKYKWVIKETPFFYSSGVRWKNFQKIKTFISPFYTTKNNEIEQEIDEKNIQKQLVNLKYKSKFHHKVFTQEALKLIKGEKTIFNINEPALFQIILKENIIPKINHKQRYHVESILRTFYKEGLKNKFKFTIKEFIEVNFKEYIKTIEFFNKKNKNKIDDWEIINLNKNRIEKLSEVEYVLEVIKNEKISIPKRWMLRLSIAYNILLINNI